MKKRRPRRTNEEITQAIHHAVLSIVKSKGFGGLTFEGVARRCRMSKPVLYRRYTNRADMYLDAIISKRSEVTFPDTTGSFRDDLYAWFEMYRKVWFANPTAYRALIGESSPETLAKVAEFETSVASLLRKKIIKPAQERGELGCFDPDDEIIKVPFRVMRDQYIFNAEKTDLFWVVDFLTGPFLRARTGWTPASKRIKNQDRLAKRAIEASGQAGQKSVSGSTDS